MWKQIENQQALQSFLKEMDNFHDCCIKELKYISGAYVAEDLSMNPINDRRVVSVVVQRQWEENAMIEMEFLGLSFLRLCPVDENYTCEITGATMCFHEGMVYWCDCEGVTASDFARYPGTIFCAKEFRWRAVENHLGEAAFYRVVAL